MNNKHLTLKDYQLFLLKSAVFLFLSWGSFISALSGVFYAPLILASTIIFALWIFKRSFNKGVRLKPSREMLLATVAFLFVTVLFSSFSTPTIFTGRDQGSFSEAAIRLSQNHKLEFSTPTSEAFFKLHGAGRALNFPGFYYTQNGSLITQFSLVYISWLATFFGIFGIIGLTIANGVLFFSFLFSFYLLSRLFLKASSSIPMMLFVFTSFVFMWFSKYTLSENVALPLAWMSILSLMLFLKSQRTLTYLIFLSSIILLCFARIEGIALFIVSMIIVFANKEARKFIRQKLLPRLFVPALFLAAIFIANAFKDIYFYKEIAKALFPSILMPKASYLGQLKNTVLPDFYNLKIFQLYGLLGFFAVGLIGVLANFWKGSFYKLIPFFVISPTLIYFFNSQITQDHPWMLRRFSFSILPAAIFYSGLLLGQAIERKNLGASQKKVKILSIVIILVLLRMNMPAFSNYIDFSENKNLLLQTQILSSQFSAKDLVLIDQKASGDGWAMVSGPMNFIFEKNAVYFFNIQDLAKLDTSNFENVYLAVPDEQVSSYKSSTIGNRLTLFKEYNFSASKLDIVPANPTKKIDFPDKIELVANGKIFKINKQ